jgi:glycosyl transferase family 25
MIEKYSNTKDSKWNFVDKIVYINLSDRTDRRKEIEKEFEEAKVPSDKIVRLEAIRDSPGHVGCSKSHIAVLEMAISKGWKNVLVVEDDAMWHKFSEGYNRLQKLVQDHPDFDVITLGNTGATFDKETGRLYDAQTTTAYLVNRSYYPILLANFQEGLKNLLVTKTMETHEERFPYEQKYCVDQYWKILQKKDKWYIVNPALMIQRPSMSSIITDSFVDYTSYFNL